MRVLIVDDDPISLDILGEIVAALGYDVSRADRGAQAFDMICRGDFRIVLSDWQMPEMSGVELCRRIRGRMLSSYVYFVLITSLDRQQNLVTGLNAGADDFITKPIDPDEISVRLRAAERIVSLESRDLIIFSLAKLAESRDPETGAHLERMREYSKLLAEHMSTLPEFWDVVDADYVRTLFQTSPLHDIGKVGIPDNVLLKPGKLTPEEFEIMKQHTVLGMQTLDAALQTNPQANYLRFARDIAWTHHEKYNGKGYPRGLKGDEIPLCGRIVAVADVYDALTTKRVYKEAFTHEQARDIIVQGSGSDFDPRVVEAFLAQEARFVAVKDHLDHPVSVGEPLLTTAPGFIPQLTPTL